MIKNYKQYEQRKLESWVNEKKDLETKTRKKKESKQAKCIDNFKPRLPPSPKHGFS